MSKVKIVLIPSGIQELLKSPDIQSVVTDVCQSIQKNAGDGYSYNVISGKKRTVGRVYADSYKAVRDNYKNNTLLKAIHR